MAWDVVGHERAIDLLRRSVARGRLSHAYLFSGPPSVGKRTLAVELARALNCETSHPPEPTPTPPASPIVPDEAAVGTPCGRCRRCRLIAEGKHPEVRVVGLQPSHRVIRVQDVEAIQADAALRPADAHRKVYIIEQAELLHPDAAARLLKTIEEPPPSVVMILTTVAPEATLPTIVSRCQHVRLRPLGREQLASYLTNVRGVDSERATLLAALAEGRVGWALHALDDDTLLDKRAWMLDELAALGAADRLERLQFARTLADQWNSRPDLVRETLATWVRWWRDVLLVQRGLGHRVLNVDRRSELDRDAGRLAPADVAAAVERARDTLLMLDQNVNARLALDIAVLDLPRAGRAA